jgi:hypothetical protein
LTLGPIGGLLTTLCGLASDELFALPAHPHGTCLPRMSKLASSEVFGRAGGLGSRSMKAQGLLSSSGIRCCSTTGLSPTLAVLNEALQGRRCVRSRRHRIRCGGSAATTRDVLREGSGPRHGPCVVHRGRTTERIGITASARGLSRGFCEPRSKQASDAAQPTVIR